MEIISVDLKDGHGEIFVVISNLIEKIRLQMFMRDAENTFNRLEEEQELFLKATGYRVSEYKAMLREVKQESNPIVSESGQLGMGA